MSGSTVVTGGAGFVGSHLTQLLVERGHRVIVLDRTWSRNLDEVRQVGDFDFVEGDIRDREACAAAIGGDVDTIYHLSAVVGVRHYLDDPLRVIDVNVGGTRNVLGVALQRGARFVLASSSEVYGKNPELPWAEDDDRVVGSTDVDRWSYSTSKAIGEHMAFAVHHSHGLPVTVVRYFNAYGPRQAPIFVLSQSIQRVLRGEPPLLYDGGTQTRCFTYIGDVVAGTVAAGESDRAVGEAFNIGSSAEITIKEAVQAVLDAAGADFGWTDLDTSAEFGAIYEDIIRRIPDPSKAERLLGWRAETPLDDGIAATLAWAGANPWWLAQEAPSSQR